MPKKLYSTFVRLVWCTQTFQRITESYIFSVSPLSSALVTYIYVAQCACLIFLLCYPAECYLGCSWRERVVGILFTVFLGVPNNPVRADCCPGCHFLGMKLCLFDFDVIFVTPQTHVLFIHIHVHPKVTFVTKPYVKEHSRSCSQNSRKFFRKCEMFLSAKRCQFL